MNARAAAALFTCTMVPLLIGMGLFPLLPLYAARFDAGRGEIGVFFALVYIASAASVMATGWAAQRVPRGGLFLAGAALGPATMLLLGHATALWQVVVLTALAWVSGGITLTLLNIFTGLLAAPASRGRIFGLMILVYPLASLAGAAAVGQLTAAYGYTVMFSALAVFWVIQPAVALLGLRDPRITRPPTRAVLPPTAMPYNRPFALLLAATLLMTVCVSVGRLGVSLVMEDLGFGPAAVAAATSVAGMATLPVAVGLAAFSDRTGRRLALVLGALAAAGGAGVLIVAASAWQFQLASALLLAGWCVGRAVGSALAADLLAAEVLGQGLAWLGAIDSLAGIVAFAATGYALDTLGARLLFAVASGLALGAMIVFTCLPVQRRPGHPAPGQPLVMERTRVIVTHAPAEAGQELLR